MGTSEVAVCRVATLPLEPRHQASSLARSFLREALTAWGVGPDSVDLALLLTSEAVTNAVVHARTASVLTVAVSGSTLEIGVQDQSSERPLQAVPAVPRQQPAETGDPLAESGRGVLLIAALAQTWGVQDLPAGKQVWFRLQVQRDEVAGTRCTCHDSEVHGIVMGSGARAVHVDS